MKTEYFWLATRDGQPCGSFKTRKEAIKWLKALLKQVSKDYENQDKTDEYNYEPELRKIEIRRYEKRNPLLGYWLLGER